MDNDIQVDKASEKEFTEREVHDLAAYAVWLEDIGQDYGRYLVEKALKLICPAYEEVYRKLEGVEG